MMNRMKMIFLLILLSNADQAVVLSSQGSLTRIAYSLASVLAANGWFFSLKAVHAGLHMRIPQNKVMTLGERAALVAGAVFFVQSALWREMFHLTEYAFI